MSVAAPSSVPPLCTIETALDSFPAVVSVSVRVPPESVSAPWLWRLRMDVDPVECTTVAPVGMQTWSAVPGKRSPLQFAAVAQAVVPAPPSHVTVQAGAAVALPSLACSIEGERRGRGQSERQCRPGKSPLGKRRNAQGFNSAVRPN